MTEPQAFAPSWAAEFPNDNPALHEGASWVCLRVTGPARAILRARPAAAQALPPAVRRPETPAVTEAVPEVPAAASNDAASRLPTLFVPAPEATAGEVTPVPALPVPMTTTVDGAIALLASEEAAPPLEEEPLAVGSSIEDEEVAAVVELWLTQQMLDVSDALATDVVVAAESIPESVLAPLLESLDLELTPSNSATAHDALSPLVLEGVEATETARARHDSEPPFEFDGGEDSVETFAAAPASAPEVVVENCIVASEPEPAPSDAYTAFVAAVVEVALNAGATRAAGALPALLDGDGDVPDELSAELVRAGIAVRNGDRAALSRGFVDTALAWRKVLRGESSDLSACGTSTLDGWSAELLKAVGVGQSGQLDVRRELRRRGVAAFGMLLAA